MGYEKLRLGYYVQRDRLIANDFYSIAKDAKTDGIFTVEFLWAGMQGSTIYGNLDKILADISTKFGVTILIKNS